MKKSHHHPDASAAVSSRLHLRAWLAVVLLLVAAVGQAWHTHGDGELRGKRGPSPTWTADAGPDTCPLCVAMHSAAPSQHTWTAETVRYTVEVAEARALAAVAVPPGHTHFSRPPPRRS